MYRPIFNLYMVLPTEFERRIDDVTRDGSTDMHQNVIREMVRRTLRLLFDEGILTGDKMKIYFDDILPR